MKNLFFLLFLMVFGQMVFAQTSLPKIKVGMDLSRQSYKYLSLYTQHGFQTDGNMASKRMMLWDGKFNFRPSFFIGIYQESKIFNLPISYGIGYRQRGFQTDYVFQPVLATDFDALTSSPTLDAKQIYQATNNRFDNIFLDVSVQIPLKSFYFGLGGRAEYLIGYSVATEFQYLISQTRKSEVSPFVLVGKKLPFLGKFSWAVEWETNIGLMNMSQESYPFYHPYVNESFLRNLSTGLRLVVGYNK